jgi:membrane-associated protease RseP (regulator of RpoE activity)
MSPAELLDAFTQSPRAALSLIPLLAAALFVHVVVHELGHCITAAMCGVSSVELSLGRGPRWLKLQLGRCEIAVGLAFMVGGSTTYASSINRIRPVPRALIAAGGAVGDGMAALAFAALASELSVPCLWLFMYVCLVSSSLSISPLHSDGRKVVGNLILALNRRSFNKHGTDDV